MKYRSYSISIFVHLLHYTHYVCVHCVNYIYEFYVFFVWLLLIVLHIRPRNDLLCVGWDDTDSVCMLNVVFCY